MVTLLKEKIIMYILVGLILTFFALPLLTYCMIDYRLNIPKKIASFLLFFCR